ncbi:MAG: zinc ribbon domain-containing protein [Methanolinea sp.]
MSDYQNTGFNSTGGEEEPEGPERYLRPGEELLIYTPDVQIKKFRFDAYLTNDRLFLTDQDEKTPGVTAKEIPIGSIAETHLEHSPSQEPILVLSIRTSDDDIRTMKMVFVHTGVDRLSQAEEWVHLIRHGRESAGPRYPEDQEMLTPATPVISPEARALSETMVFPDTPRVEKSTTIPSLEPAASPAAELTRTIPVTYPAKFPETKSPPKTGHDAVTTQIQFCFHCGHRVPPNANFCPYCGTRMASGHHAPEIPAPVQARKEVSEQEKPPEKEKKSRLRWPFRKK